MELTEILGLRCLSLHRTHETLKLSLALGYLMNRHPVLCLYRCCVNDRNDQNITSQTSTALDVT